jgi:predicted acylesterase/phospholipase RssA
MKKISLVFLFSLAFCLGSCVSRTEVRSEETTPLPDAPDEKGFGGKGKRVALVLGGAGVASFATVGLLKKLFEEGVQVDFIVASGWPALFALADGFSKSVHDMEWFATRLDAKDFERMGEVDFRREIDPSQVLPGLVLKSFPQTLLSESRVPVVIAAPQSDQADGDVFATGEWKEPLLRAFSLPGLYHRISAERGTAWVDSVKGLEVQEALRRGATKVIAVAMYEDFVQWVATKPSKDDELVRRLYASRLKKSNQEASKLAHFSSSVVLKKSPLDFSAKRAAILAGYREGTRVIKALREIANSAAN